MLPEDALDSALATVSKARPAAARCGCGLFTRYETLRYN